MIKSAPKKVENAVGKGETAFYKQFLFSTGFSKDLFCRQLTWVYLEKACFTHYHSKPHFY